MKLPYKINSKGKIAKDWLVIQNKFITDLKRQLFDQSDSQMFCKDDIFEITYTQQNK